MEKKKKKRMGGGLRALIVIAVVLLVLVGVPYLYLSIGFDYDDMEALAEGAPMSETERYRFHADSRTADIALDYADVAWLIQHEGGMEAMLEGAADTLNALDISVEKTGVRFADGHAYLNAKLLYKKFIPLPLQAELSVSGKQGTVRASVESVKLGRLITVDAEKLPIDADTLTFEVDAAAMHSRMKTLSRAWVEGDRLMLNCAVGDELVAEMLENMGQVRAYADYLGMLESVEVAEEVCALGSAGSLFDAMLKQSEQDPAHFIAFRQSALALAEDFKASLFYMAPETELLERFMPGIAKESVSALSAQYDAQMTERRGQLQTMVLALETLNKDRQLSTDGIRFLNLAEDGAALTLSQLLGGTAYTEWLDGDSARVVYAYQANYYMTQALDKISAMPKAADDAFAGMKGNEKYVPVIMTRLLWYERPVIAFYIKGGDFTLMQLSEEDYAALMASERIPVFDLQIKDYKG